MSFFFFFGGRFFFYIFNGVFRKDNQMSRDVPFMPVLGLTEVVESLFLQAGTNKNKALGDTPFTQ